jgi:hypothetical protein
VKKELKLIQEEGDEQGSLEMYLAAPALQSVIWDMTQWLRSKTKHADGDVAQFEEARERLWALIADENLEKFF